MEFVGESGTKIDEEFTLTMIEAKWRGKVYPFELDINHTSVGDLKAHIKEETNIPCDRMKLLGLGNISQKDDLLMSSYASKVKKGKLVVTVMGTPDEEIKNMESTRQNSESAVVNDFGHTFTPATEEWHKLKEHIDSLKINFIHQPRPGYKLLVLDLDHTILDFSSKGVIDVELMKRPFMEFFLETVYECYDIAVWSQTHWQWVEIKLVELGILNHPRFKICFYLDKTSMFRSFTDKQYLKPLDIIWSKYPLLWGKHNTLHIDDLDRNFALNKQNGILVTAYYRTDREKKRRAALESEAEEMKTWAGFTNREFGESEELVALASYLLDQKAVADVSSIDHSRWKLKMHMKIRGIKSEAASSSSSADTAADNKKEGGSNA